MRYTVKYKRTALCRFRTGKLSAAQKQMNPAAARKQVNPASEAVRSSEKQETQHHHKREEEIKMRHRALSVLLAGTLVLGLAACGGGNKPAETTAAPAATQAEAPFVEEEPLPPGFRPGDIVL